MGGCVHAEGQMCPELAVRKGQKRKKKKEISELLPALKQSLKHV